MHIVLGGSVTNWFRCHTEMDAIKKGSSSSLSFCRGSRVEGSMSRVEGTMLRVIFFPFFYIENVLLLL